MQIARPQAAKVSKMLIFDTFGQTGNKSPDNVRAFLTVWPAASGSSRMRQDLFFYPDGRDVLFMGRQM